MSVDNEPPVEGITITAEGHVEVSGFPRELVQEACAYYASLIDPAHTPYEFNPDFLQRNKDVLRVDFSISMLALRGLHLKSRIEQGRPLESDVKRHPLYDAHPLVQALGKASMPDKGAFLPLDEVKHLIERGVLQRKAR